MIHAIGSVLPLALGIAISPIPIIAAILMLLSPKARGTSVGFLLGWLLGIVVAVVVFTLLSSLLPAPGDHSSNPTIGAIKIVLGIVLLLLAVRRWRSRPKGGAEPTLPKWMAAIDTMSVPTALGLGFLLSAVNPKNLLLAVAAGVDIGASGVTVGESVVVIAVFVVIAASTVAVPVIGFLVASARLTTPLHALHTWLVDNNALVMSIVLLVLGFVVIGKGLANF